MYEEFSERALKQMAEMLPGKPFKDKPGGNTIGTVTSAQIKDGKLEVKIPMPKEASIWEAAPKASVMMSHRISASTIDVPCTRTNEAGDVEITRCVEYRCKCANCLDEHA